MDDETIRVIEDIHTRQQQQPERNIDIDMEILQKFARKWQTAVKRWKRALLDRKWGALEKSVGGFGKRLVTRDQTCGYMRGTTKESGLGRKAKRQRTGQGQGKGFCDDSLSFARPSAQVPPGTQAQPYYSQIHPPACQIRIFHEILAIWGEIAASSVATNPTFHMVTFFRPLFALRVPWFEPGCALNSMLPSNGEPLAMTASTLFQELGRSHLALAKSDRQKAQRQRRRRDARNDIMVFLDDLGLPQVSSSVVSFIPYTALSKVKKCGDSCVYIVIVIEFGEPGTEHPYLHIR
ncbi:hypothetical protein PAAG_07454 [Paracoccidioides lutzii Pb01]|uniref:Uncharacterized protein n=1 Tax=Paracoccidioides lutzii (strain ATCC MYA-826 / Pb01) TaxID=502779 RepID=C1H9L3_PARBA|nr:hypothetical protein PAAG_07454 [Paracoccidioides lutzii Pb01]EEH37036.2 hypothetical protein PAAG_07454 [Paracoccidioides lutzii Pb01]